MASPGEFGGVLSSLVFLSSLNRIPISSFYVL